MYKYIILILAVQLLANPSVMQQYDSYLSEDDYKAIKKQGITSFEYFSCHKANAGQWVETGESSISFVSNTIIPHKTKIAKELFELLTSYMYRQRDIDREDESQEWRLESKEKLAKIESSLVDFFEVNKNFHDVNLLNKPVLISLENKKWFCHEEVNFNIVSEFKYIDMDTFQLFYNKYRSELKSFLANESFSMLGLLGNDLTFSNDNIALLNQKTFHEKQLLDVLLFLKRYSVVKHYKDILTQNYTGNPFAADLSGTYNQDLVESIKNIKELGFNFFVYSKNLDYNNLYLSIKNKKKSSIELIDNLESLDNLRAYIYYSIEFEDNDSFEYIFEKYPEVKYTKLEVSEIILEVSKRNNLDMVKYIITEFPYEKYDNVVDAETGLSALGYAKEARYGGEKLAVYLEEHNFKSDFVSDSSRNISNFFKDVGEVFNGIGYVIAIGLGGYGK